MLLETGLEAAPELVFVVVPGTAVVEVAGAEVPERSPRSVSATRNASALRK